MNVSTVATKNNKTMRSTNSAMHSSNKTPMNGVFLVGSLPTELLRTNEHILSLFVDNNNINNNNFKC